MIRFIVAILIALALGVVLCTALQGLIPTDHGRIISVFLLLALVGMVVDKRMHQ